MNYIKYGIVDRASAKANELDRKSFAVMLCSASKSNEISPSLGYIRIHAFEVAQMIAD